MTTSSYLHEMFSLDGRVAVVTGGSSGIGRAITAALARAGASVVVVARDQERLAEITGELTADGCRAAWVSADLSSRERIRAAAEEAAAVFGEPDILVNSAGVNLRPPLGELDEPTWDTTMTVNLEAPFLLGQRFGPGMAGRGLRAADPHQLAAGPSRVRAERRLRRVQGRPGIAVPVPGRSLVPARGDQQHPGPRLRHDPA